jgi:LysM repeat protein
MYNKKRFDLAPNLKLGVGRGAPMNSNKILKLTSIGFLIVSAILATNSIRVIFKNSGDGTAANPQVLGVSDNATQTANEPQFIDYTVATGDTLFSIAQKNNVSWTTLAALNKLDVPFNLKKGQVIKIPKQ